MEDNFNYINSILVSIDNIKNDLEIIKNSLNTININDSKELNYIESLITKSIKKLTKEQVFRIKKPNIIFQESLKSKFPTIED